MKLIAGSILIGFSVLNLTLSSLQGTFGTSSGTWRKYLAPSSEPEIILNFTFGFNASAIAIALTWVFLAVGVGLIVWGLLEFRSRTS